MPFKSLHVHLIITLSHIIYDSIEMCRF